MLITKARMSCLIAMLLLVGMPPSSRSDSTDQKSGNQPSEAAIPPVPAEPEDYFDQYLVPASATDWCSPVPDESRCPEGPACPSGKFMPPRLIDPYPRRLTIPPSPAQSPRDQPAPSRSPPLQQPMPESPQPPPQTPAARPSFDFGSNVSGTALLASRSVPATIGDFIGFNSGIRAQPVRSPLFDAAGLHPVRVSLGQRLVPLSGMGSVADPFIFETVTTSDGSAIDPRTGTPVTITGARFEGVIDPGDPDRVVLTPVTNADTLADNLNTRNNFAQEFQQFQATPGTTENLTFTATTGGQRTTFDVDANSDYSPFGQGVAPGGTPPMIDLPQPGMHISKYKVGESSSPIPRDRVFFQYSFFNNTPLSSPGSESLDVNRFVPGFEKTFLNGDMSIEVRLPFSSTLGPDIFNEPGRTNTSNVQLGNMVINLKALLYSVRSYGWTAGVALETPTAEANTFSVVVNDVETPVARVLNRSVHIAPYVGFVSVGDDNTFLQSFLQIDVDANGNPVQIADNFGRPLRTRGSWDQPTTLFADVSAGVWAFRHEEAKGAEVSGLALISELHYTSTLEATDFVSNGTFQVGEKLERLDALNLTLGGTLEFGSQSTLTTAYVVPLTGGLGRQFDGEFQVLFNYFFGPRNRLQRGVY